MKTKLRLMSLAFISLLALGSCSSDDSGSINSNYAGVYEGVYSGDETGTFSMVVNSDGSVTGHAIRRGSYDPTWYGAGSVNDSGQVTVRGTVDSGAVWSGSITGDNVNGNWSNDRYNMSGSFAGSKVD